MSKREKHKYSSKNNKRSKKRIVKFDRKLAVHNKGKTRIPLKERLRRVYEDTVDLSTSCAGKCDCCKVAMPQMNYCEFTQLAKEIWDKESKSSKVELICTSIDYFFRNEFDKWNLDSLVKPCMLLSDEGRCKYYDSRPLSCRMYGLWPEKDYEARVDRFEKGLEGKLKREEIPLNTQCPLVERTDNSVELTSEVIEDLFNQLDDIDVKIGSYSSVQVKERLNYRTFHDWLLLKIFGEEWLTTLTTFILAADRETLQSQIEELKKVAKERFAKDMPDL